MWYIKTMEHKRTFAVIGLNKFGKKVAETLCGKGAHLIIIDQDERALERFKDIAGVTTIEADATDEEALKNLGVENVDVAVVAMGTNVAASILVTTGLKTLGIREIIARARSQEQVRALKRVGATRVVFPEEDIAQRIAYSIIAPGVREFFEMAAHFDIILIDVPLGLIGKQLGELKLNEKFNVNVIAVKHKAIDEEGTVREEGTAELARNEYVLRKKDILLVVGDEKNIEKLEEDMVKKKKW